MATRKSETNPAVTSLNLKSMVQPQDTKTVVTEERTPGTLMIALIASMKTRFLLREKLVITRFRGAQNFAVWGRLP